MNDRNRTQAFSRENLMRAADQAGALAAEKHAQPFTPTHHRGGGATWTCGECGETHRVPQYWPSEDQCPCQRAAFEKAGQAYYDANRPRAVAWHMEQAGIPPRFAGATLDSFQPRKGAAIAMRACKRWVDGFTLDTTTGLFLQGPFGSGKTHMAIGVLRAAVERALPHARFVNVAELLARVRAGMATHEADAPVRAALAAELLVLDDLAQDSLSEWGRGIVWEVLDGRYRGNRPTILTSNASDVQIRERLGGAVLGCTRCVSWCP